MRRVVVGYDQYRFGHRAAARDGLSSTSLYGAIVQDAAPTAPHVVSGVGEVWGAAIDPDSEVRGVMLVDPGGRHVPVYEGSPARIRRRIDRSGDLTIDALEAHDGELILWVAETPDEVDALPIAPVAGYRRAWMVYDSAAEQYRVYALPRHAWGAAAELSYSTWEGRQHADYLEGAYLDDGLNVDSHALEIRVCALSRVYPAVGAQSGSPSWEARSVTDVSVVTPRATPEPYSRALRAPSGDGARWCVVLHTTVGTGAGSGPGGSRHRIQIGRAR